MFRLVCCFALLVAGCSHKPPYQGKSVAELERMLRGSDAAAQAEAAYGLSLLGPEAKDATPALIEALHSDQALVRQNAALALGRIGPEARPAVPALIETLRDAEWNVRRQAAIALGEIGDAQAAAPALQSLANDPNRLVRQAAKDALVKVRGAGTAGKK